MISLLLSDFGDGGEFTFSSNQLQTDDSLVSVIYVSLFGGNNAIDKLNNDIDYDEFSTLLELSKEDDDISVINQGNDQLTWLSDDGYCDSCSITAITSNDDRTQKTVTIEIDNQIKINLEV